MGIAIQHGAKPREERHPADGPICRSYGPSNQSPLVQSPNPAFTGLCCSPEALFLSVAVHRLTSGHYLTIQKNSCYDSQHVASAEWNCRYASKELAVPAALDLKKAIARFGADAKPKLANPGVTGEPKDDLRAPLEGLFADSVQL